MRANGQAYKGINVLMLWGDVQLKGFVCPIWMTSRQAQHVFEYDYETFVKTLNDYFTRVMVFCQNDEYIYAGHPSTAWNFVAVCFK